MDNLIKAARKEAISKLAGYGVTTVGQLRPSTKRRKRRPKKGGAEALILPEEPTPDFWASPVGSYLRGATLGAGTATGLGYALGGLHWSGRTPLFQKTKDFAKTLKDVDADSAQKWLRKARMSKLVHKLSLGGALAGLGATAFYRNRANKRRKELAKMPQQLVVKVPAQIKTSSIDPPKPKAPKPPKLKKTPKDSTFNISKPQGPSPKEQSIEITTNPINKAAHEAAVNLLERL